MKSSDLIPIEILFALILSLCIHLFFVTALEAAISLSKVWEPSAQISISILKSHDSSAVSHRHRSVGSKLDLPIQRFSEAPEVQGFDNQIEDQNRSRITPEVAKPKENENKSYDQALQKFEHAQIRLDQRIKKFFHELTSRVENRQDQSLIESLKSNVSDLEKVPLQVRKDVLPAYLERMRAKIATYWTRLIEEQRIDSGVAAIEFQILADGVIANLKLVSVAGEESFKDSCLTAVRASSPFEALPFRFEQELSERYLTIHLTFHLRRSNS